MFYFENGNADDEVKLYRYWMYCMDKCTNEEGRELLALANDYNAVKKLENAGSWYFRACAANKTEYCVGRRENIEFGSEAAGCHCNEGKIIFNTADTYIGRYFLKNVL